jgi:two-component system, OmpR family, alkaline phosphatase synthesis response regulator PhoP
MFGRAPDAVIAMKTILVVDDEPKIVQVVRDYLERAGYGVRVAHDGKSALAAVRSEKPDMVILDLGLPELDGLDVTRELRKFSDAPIIMLTARSEETDKLVGLELGADDYVTKPFSPKELVARVRAVFRRIESHGETPPEIIRASDLVLDVPRLRVTAHGREIEELTPTEFELLAALARSPGRVFTRAQLLDRIHGVAFESYERAIDAHIKNIRRKIERNPHEPAYILTVYGVGYRFNDR